MNTVVPPALPEPSAVSSASLAPASPAALAIAPHAVARLRNQRLQVSTRPFLSRGGPVPRCPSCRLRPSHCLCELHQPALHTTSGMCLLMHTDEPLKPSNTGWLIADMVADTHAFLWARTEVDPALIALLQDPQWAPHLVFPAEFAPPERVGQLTHTPPNAASLNGKRPLFVMLDATWVQARKMFNKSPYLAQFPILSLQPEALSGYRLRRSTRSEHLCTSEIAALCLSLTGDARDALAAEGLATRLDLFTEHYLHARDQRKLDHQSLAHHAWARWKAKSQHQPQANGSSTHPPTQVGQTHSGA